jgi:hypothetical protein
MACPHCGAELKIPEQYAGKRGRCGKCRQSIDVPAPTIEPEFIPDLPTPPSSNTSVPTATDTQQDQRAASTNKTSVLWLVIAGAAVGGLLGFLLRPSVPLIGQLPFQHVITRGAILEGLDEILIPTARQSFNRLMGGIIIGIVGVLAGARLSPAIADRVEWKLRREQLLVLMFVILLLAMLLLTQRGCLGIS